MADTKTQAEERTETKGTATTPATLPAPRPTGIAPIPPVGLRIGSEPEPAVKGAAETSAAAKGSWSDKGDFPPLASVQITSGDRVTKWEAQCNL